MAGQPPNLSDAKRLYAAGNPEGALRICQAILAITPQNLDARFLAGISAMKSGMAAEGVPLLEAFVREVPGFLDAHIWLSVGYRALGDLRKSIQAAEHACEMRPNDAHAKNALGHALQSSGRLGEAADAFNSAVKLDPKQPLFKLYLGLALHRLARFDQANQAFESAIAAASQSLNANLSIARELLANRYLDGAETSARRAFELDSSSRDARVLWANSLIELGKLDQAEIQIRAGLAESPGDAELYGMLGALLHRQGKLREAEAQFRKAIALRPGYASVYLSLAQIKTFSLDDFGLIEEMNLLLEDPSASAADRGSLHFALGKAHEDIENFERAMRHYDQANEIAFRLKPPERAFDREELVNRVDQSITLFNPDLFEQLRNLGNPSAMPMLIVGMIRSGTTLVEQILASHPQVAGAGEISFWVPQSQYLVDLEKQKLAADLLPAKAAAYLSMLESLGHGESHVTDKMPANFLVLGLIHLALPNARLILMRRDPRDNCLSTYVTPNKSRLEFLHNKADISFAYRQHSRLTDHWRRVISPQRLMTVDYEQLVTEPEPVIRWMLDFCGLPWDDRCLRPEENPRAVATPSATQVRQPIHPDSVGRWRRFEPWLTEFSDL